MRTSASAPSKLSPALDSIKVAILGVAESKLTEWIDTVVRVQSALRKSEKVWHVSESAGAASRAGQDMNVASPESGQETGCRDRFALV